MKKIAIDMMGSDNGATVLSQAVKKYLKDHDDVSFLLFGDEAELKKEFASSERVEIRGTTTIIPMEIKPLDFLRSKTFSNVSTSSCNDNPSISIFLFKVIRKRKKVLRAPT